MENNSFEIGDMIFDHDSNNSYNGIEKYLVRGKDKQFYTAYQFDKVKYENYPFLHELKGCVEIQGSILHPNIQKFHDLIDHNGQIFVLFDHELLSFLSLFENCNKINEERCRHILLHLMKGIDHLHSNMIIHNDISPYSLYISSSQEIVIKNFMKSRKYESQSGMSNSKGVLNFRAPELIVGGAKDPFKVDIWACGILLLMCLKYENPIKGTTEEDISHSILSFEYKKEPYISDEFDNLLKKMLQKDPNRRATSKEILEDPWLIKKPDSIVWLFDKGATAQKLRVETKMSLSRAKEMLLPFMTQYGFKITYRNQNKVMSFQIRQPHNLLFNIKIDERSNGFVDYIITKLSSDDNDFFDKIINEIIDLFQQSSNI